MNVPFFRPTVGEEEIEEVVSTLRSGWLTTGPKVKRFEEEFARAVNAKYAVALNSCTAALHLAVEAIGLREGEAVLIPTMTFAATAEIILYKKAVPVLVDCDPVTGNMDLEDAARKIEKLKNRSLPFLHGRQLKAVGMIPVHVGGSMMNVDEVTAFAARHGLWVVEDAAHAFPAAWRRSSTQPWQYCGSNTARVSCFSFYANKTITTGEGGMAVTDDAELADRIRLLSLHGLSHDAWGRYSGKGTWDYRIVAPGYKYNLTDVAAGIGIHQLARAEQMRRVREEIALELRQRLATVDEVDLPPVDEDRLHAWHLFPIRLRLDHLSIDRDAFIAELYREQVSCSVHWRPLHLHPYYEETFGWQPDDLPAASKMWPRLVSLPLFSAMRRPEIDWVVEAVERVCRRSSAAQSSSPSPASAHVSDR